MYGNFQLFADGIEVTDYAGNVSWQNTIDELATSLSFETAKTDMVIFTPILSFVFHLIQDLCIHRTFVVMFLIQEALKK